MRGGVGKLKSLGYAIYDSFVNRSNVSDNIKYLFTQLGNTLSVYAAYAILTYLTVNEFRDGVDNLFDDEDDDKERKEKEEQTWEMINKYLFNGALIKPFASILAGETVTTEYQNRDISASLYQMFIDPFVDAAKDNDKETNSLTALKDMNYDRSMVTINPVIKDPVESIKGNTEIQALPTYTNDKSFL